MIVITIGRSAKNDRVIHDRTVSRHHCQIIRDDYGNYRIVDFGSKNGTYINDKRIEGEVDLQPTDRLRVGSSTIPWQKYFLQPPNKGTYSQTKQRSSLITYDIRVLRFLLWLIAVGVVGYIVYRIMGCND